jgi:RHS repeat-associated protein
VTNAKGAVSQHVEYFAFGETFVEESNNTQRTPYSFTGKEFDEETGLYYFGARYFDARTSVWASPILAKYLPTENKEKDQQLPGMGGVFNSFNLGLYSYGHLNPVKFVDGTNVPDPKNKKQSCDFCSKLAEKNEHAKENILSWSELDDSLSWTGAVKDIVEKGMKIYDSMKKEGVSFRSYKLKDAVSDLKLIAEVVYNAGKNLNIATKGGSLIIKGLVKAKWMKESLNQSKIETQLELFCPSHEEGGRFGGAGASGEW